MELHITNDYKLSNTNAYVRQNISLATSTIIAMEVYSHIADGKIAATVRATVAAIFAATK